MRYGDTNGLSGDNMECDCLELIPITDSKVHLEQTFGLIQRRHSVISHCQTPTFEEHAEFVRNHPYRYWFIVTNGGSSIGTVYLHVDNSVGLNLLVEHRSKAADVLLKVIAAYDPLPPIKSVRNGRFIINVPVADQRLAEDVLAIGGIEIQRTFVLSDV